MAPSITNNVNPPPQLLMKDNAVEEWRLWKEMYADYAIITKLDMEWCTIPSPSLTRRTKMMWPN